MSKNALMHELDAENVWRPVRGTGGSNPANSSSANIGIGDAFTGTGVDVSQYGTISVAIQASHSSATGGLAFQGSFDNTTWFDMETYTYTATGLKIYSMAPAGKYFRVKYTNGGTATTSFNLLTTFTNAYTKPSSQRIGDDITAENDAELVKAVLAAQKPNGSFTDIDCTAGGNLKVSVEEVETNVVFPTGGSTTIVGVSLTRPADTTAYAAKDVVSDSTSAPTVLTFANFARVNAGTGIIVKARIMTSQKTNTAQFRLHLFHTAPTAINDNSPYLMLYANAANRIGMIDFPAMSSEDPTNSTAAATMRPSSDGSYSTPNLVFKAASASRVVYGILEAVTAFTPDSGQLFYIELSTIND